MSGATSAGGMAVLQLDGALLFFDLAGTLVAPNTRLPHSYRFMLRRLGHRTRRIVLVTGQASDDPQVQEVLAFFATDTAPDFVAYTTRGGLRLERRGGTFERDLAYLADTRLEDVLRPAVEQEVARVLARCRLQPLVPVQCLDDVAVRVNLQPANRPRFVAALAAHLAEVDMAYLQVVAEGRTSIFVLRRGIGKRRAVQYELDRAKQEGIVAPALYFGNEVAAGNDREVLGLAGLEICALGPCGPVPIGTRCQTIGEGPNDLYAVIHASLDAVRTADRPLPVVCA